MTIADSLRKLAYQVRAIPGQFGIRPYSVYVVTRTFGGEDGLSGAETTTTTAVTEADGQPPKVRWLNGEERALSGLGSGAVEVGPITPYVDGIGTLLATLNGSALADQGHIQFKLVGPDFPSGQLFRIEDVSTDRALHYTVTLSPVSDA